MPEANVRFHLAVDVPTLRQLLSDPAFVAGSIPQVVAVERLSPTTARWTVQVKVGPLTRKSLYDGELVEASDDGVRFRATGPEATIVGALRFLPLASGGTDVELLLTMNGTGTLRAVLDAYLARHVRDDAEQFAHSLGERLVPPSAGSG